MYYENNIAGEYTKETVHLEYDIQEAAVPTYYTQSISATVERIYCKHCISEAAVRFRHGYFINIVYQRQRHGYTMFIVYQIQRCDFGGGIL